MQLLPASGTHSASLWDAPSIEELQAWLNEHISVDCKHAVYEVRGGVARAPARAPARGPGTYKERRRPTRSRARCWARCRAQLPRPSPGPGAQRAAAAAPRPFSPPRPPPALLQAQEEFALGIGEVFRARAAEKVAAGTKDVADRTAKAMGQAATAVNTQVRGAERGRRRAWGGRRWLFFCGWGGGAQLRAAAERGAGCAAKRHTQHRCSLNTRRALASLRRALPAPLPVPLPTLLPSRPPSPSVPPCALLLPSLPSLPPLCPQVHEIDTKLKISERVKDAATAVSDSAVGRGTAAALTKVGSSVRSTTNKVMESETVRGAGGGQGGEPGGGEAEERRMRGWQGGVGVGGRESRRAGCPAVDPPPTAPVWDAARTTRWTWTVPFCLLISPPSPSPQPSSPSPQPSPQMTSATEAMGAGFKKLGQSFSSLTGRMRRNGSDPAELSDGLSRSTTPESGAAPEAYAPPPPQAVPAEPRAAAAAPAFTLDGDHP